MELLDRKGEELTYLTSIVRAIETYDTILPHIGPDQKAINNLMHKPFDEDSYNDYKEIIDHVSRFLDSQMKPKKSEEEKKNKGNRFYSEFMKLLEDFGDKLPYLKSTIRSVEKYAPIFRRIGPDLDAITNFMNNSFDEDIHKDYKKTIKKVCQLVALQMETPGSGQENTVHALLRTLHFLKRTDNEE
jgi:hypothetical protein